MRTLAAEEEEKYRQRRDDLRARDEEEGRLDRRPPAGHLSVRDAVNRMKKKDEDPPQLPRYPHDIYLEEQEALRKEHSNNTNNCNATSTTTGFVAWPNPHLGIALKWGFLKGNLLCVGKIGSAHTCPV